MNLAKRVPLFIIMFFLVAPLFIVSAQEVMTDSCETDAVCSAIVKITEYITMLGGVVVALFIILGGFLYATGGGNEKQVSTAKSMITCAIIGMVIILASNIIVTTVKNLLGFS
ncbi:MAG: hypothetical protein MCSN_5820 [Candidatus Microsyncoccus archaeolyticus]|nr:MAG: hypothetical protein MCSN_5820 [Candidatus Parcubacteria bacterium]